MSSTSARAHGEHDAWRVIGVIDRADLLERGAALPEVIVAAVGSLWALMKEGGDMEVAGSER